MNKKIAITIISASTLIVLVSFYFGYSLIQRKDSLNSPNPTPTPGKKGTVTITFTTFFEEDGQAAAYKDIISLFESRNSDIKVNLQAGGANYDTNINTALTEGKGPDIIGLQRNKMLQYISENQIMDLTDWVTEQNLKDNYYGVSIGYGKYKDKYYGIGDLPYTVEWFYNTNEFERLGISQPENLSELIAVCNKFKKYNQSPISIGAKDYWTLNTFFGLISGQTIATDELSEAFIKNDKDNYMALNGALEALDITRQLVKSGAINKKVVGDVYANSIDAFVKGKSPILPMGSWAVDKINSMKGKNFSYGVFDKPVSFKEGANSLYSATSVQVIVVNEKTKREEEVKKFLTFLFSDEAQKIFAGKNGISGFKAANGETEDEVKRQILKHLEETDENSTMYIDNISPKMMEVTGTWLAKLIDGKSSPQEAWRHISEESTVK